MPKQHDNNFQYGATLLRLKTLFDLNLLQNPEKIDFIFYKSVFVECVIELRYLLQGDEFKHIVDAINFRDDVQSFTLTGGRSKDSYEDVVSLIKFYRDAICHGEATNKRTNLNNQHVAYAFQVGAKPKYPGGLPHLCKYDDDIACVFGNHVLYIKRHLERLFNAFLEKVYDLPEQRAFKQLLELRQKSPKTEI
jgi:hypothetical protein